MAWLRAKLRDESGAVIGKGEASDEYKTYFPVIGDTPERIAQKRALRQSAMDEMRLKAGKAAPKVDEVRGKEDQNPLTRTPAKNAQGWLLYTDKNGNKAYVSPDGKQYQKVQ